MSDTRVENVNPDTMFDLFQNTEGVNNLRPQFGMGEIAPVDIFSPPTSSTTEETTLPPAAAEGPKTPETPTTPDTGKPDADILGTGEAKTPPQTGAVLADLPSYYQDRIKNGKFIAITDQDDKGNEIPFIPKTAEEYDEVLELQINYRLDQAKKDMEKNWYASKSPAWRAVSQYAELVDDPTQLIPFLQGVRTLTSVANIDENDPEGAEAIVRTRLVQKGDTEEIIAQQIDALKTTDKLVSTAKMYKPVILQQEQVQLQRDLREKQEQERNYQMLIADIRESALKSIETPLFGKTKLKQDEKAAIYDLIAEPAEETQGYGIYNVIDQLFDTKDFEKLKEVALLLSNRDAFMNYLGINVANATAASLERKLRLAGESRAASGNDFHEDGQPRVQRNQFKSKPTFGR